MTTPVIVKALLPDVELDTKGRPNLRQLATLPNLLNILGQLDMSIRYNLMKNEMELVGPGIAATEASQEKHVLCSRMYYVRRTFRTGSLKLLYRHIPRRQHRITPWLIG